MEDEDFCFEIDDHKEGVCDRCNKESESLNQCGYCDWQVCEACSPSFSANDGLVGFHCKTCYNITRGDLDELMELSNRDDREYARSQNEGFFKRVRGAFYYY